MLGSIFRSNRHCGNFSPFFPQLNCTTLAKHTQSEDGALWWLGIVRKSTSFSRTIPFFFCHKSHTHTTVRVLDESTASVLRKSSKLPSYLRTISPSFSRLPTTCRCKNRNVNQKQATFSQKQGTFFRKQRRFSRKQGTFFRKQGTIPTRKDCLNSNSRHTPLAMQLALFKLLKYL